MLHYDEYGRKENPAILLLQGKYWNYTKKQAIHITTKEQAQNAPTPFTTFTLFYNGEFMTHEILSEKNKERELLFRLITCRHRLIQAYYISVDRF